ncbi:unnamed protein product, partial [Prorocentrum cordatum]
MACWCRAQAYGWRMSLCDLGAVMCYVARGENVIKCSIAQASGGTLTVEQDVVVFQGNQVNDWTVHSAPFIVSSFSGPYNGVLCHSCDETFADTNNTGNCPIQCTFVESTVCITSLRARPWIPTAHRRVARLQCRATRPIASRTTPLTRWMSWAGPPQASIADLGGEFEREFRSELEGMGAELIAAAALGPTQNIVCERRGGEWKYIAEAIIDEYQMDFTVPGAVERLCNVLNWAKNSKVGPTGYSPAQWVLGRGCRLPCSILSNPCHREQHDKLFGELHHEFDFDHQPLYHHHFEYQHGHIHYDEQRHHRHPYDYHVHYHEHRDAGA